MISQAGWNGVPVVPCPVLLKGLTSSFLSGHDTNYRTRPGPQSLDHPVWAEYGVWV